MIARHQISRMVYTIRKRVSAALLEGAAGMRVDVAAEHIADGVVLYIRASVLGYQKSRTLYLDTPDGSWQSLRACLGLRYRKKTITVEAMVLFPELSACVSPNVYIEVDRGEI